jgi:hypothetical protein
MTTFIVLGLAIICVIAFIGYRLSEIQIIQDNNNIAD